MAIWSFSMKTWMRKIMSKHCQKTFSILHKTCLATEIIHACFNMTVLQPTQLSNCHMVGEAGNIHHAMAIPVPDPQYKRTSLRFYGQRDRESHACHEKWPDSSLHNPWLSITVPYLHNLYNPLPRRVRTVTRWRGYPTKYWLTKYFHSKDNNWICLTSPERNIFCRKIYT